VPALSKSGCAHVLRVSMLSTRTGIVESTARKSLPASRQAAVHAWVASALKWWLSTSQLLPYSASRSATSENWSRVRQMRSSMEKAECARCWRVLDGDIVTTQCHQVSDEGKWKGVILGLHSRRSLDSRLPAEGGDSERSPERNHRILAKSRVRILSGILKAGRLTTGRRSVAPSGVAGRHNKGFFCQPVLSS
jgi:hypothetical protein